MMNPKVCWIETFPKGCYSWEEFGTAIVFAEDEPAALVAAAKWHGWCPEREPIHGVSRAPEFDSFAEAGEVPAEELLANSWILVCGYCGNQVEEEGTEVEDEETGEISWVLPVCIGVDAYCSQSCLDSLIERQQENKRKKEARS